MACAVAHDATRLDSIKNLPTTSRCVALLCSVRRSAREAMNSNWASDSIALDRFTVRIYTRRVVEE